eukprot:augustus_masked-scaffold_5-processed-gene-12.3-mRNA-1 protein AED:1.00 eAED:1.00 QI:0/0/0/0/1/1/2/0/272
MLEMYEEEEKKLFFHERIVLSRVKSEEAVNEKLKLLDDCTEVLQNRTEKQEKRREELFERIRAAIVNLRTKIKSERMRQKSARESITLYMESLMKKTMDFLVNEYKQMLTQNKLTLGNTTNELKRLKTNLQKFEHDIQNDLEARTGEHGDVPSKFYSAREKFNMEVVSLQESFCKQEEVLSSYPSSPDVLKLKRNMKIFEETFTQLRENLADEDSNLSKNRIHFSRLIQETFAGLREKIVVAQNKREKKDVDNSEIVQKCIEKINEMMMNLL